MSPSTALYVARDLANIADKVRGVDPASANSLDLDRELLLDSAEPMTVSETVKMLGQSRPTVHDWLKRGILDEHPNGTAGKRLIDPRSVAMLLPFIDEWRETGGTKRALGIIIARLEEAETAEMLAHATVDERGRPVVREGAIGIGIDIDN